MTRHSGRFRTYSRANTGLAVAGLMLALVWLATGSAAASGHGPSPSVRLFCDGRSRGCAALKVVRLAKRATGPATASPRKAASPASRPDNPFRVLQMNLCNSGHAGCFQGGYSPTEAASLILEYQPTVVTLNEICYDDVYKPGAPMPSAMQEVSVNDGDDTYYLEFQPAWNRSTNSAYQCMGGRGEYGIAILARGPSTGGHDSLMVEGRIYADQDTSSNEERGWLCLGVRGRFDACTTHLASTNSAVAAQQCQDLMDSSVSKLGVPSFRYYAGYDPAVVAGDLNMTYGGSPDAQACVPSGWFRTGDGDVQHVMATSNFGFVSSRTIGMAYTDHPALLVDLTYPNRAGSILSGITGKCADVRGSQTTNGTAVQLYTCKGTNAQR